MLGVILSSVTTVLTYGLICLVGVWIWFQWSYRAIIHEASGLHCSFPRVPYVPQKLPIVGHVHLSFLFGFEKASDFALSMMFNAKAKGINTICYWCGPLPVIVILGLDDIRKVLNSSSTSEKGDEMDYFKYATGNGLLTAPGEIWKVTRRHENPLFHPRNVEQLMPNFNENSRELLSILSKHVGQGPVDILNPIMDITLKTVCHLIFGPDVEFNIESKEFRGLSSIIKSVPELFIKRIIQLWLRNDTIFKFLYRKKLQKITKLFNNFTDIPLKKATANNALKKSKQVSLENHIDEDGALDGEQLNLLDIFSVLKKKYPMYTDKELRDEMITLYLTGTDTVSVAVSYCLLLLAKYPDIQERLYQEISSVVGPDSDVTLEDLYRMPYLDQVYKETLRWSTLVPFILRKAAEDVKLSSCTIPTGNTVIVGLIGIHMDPKIYPDPQKFDPDRFSPENCLGRERYGFLPFSGGPRNCIGKAYSNMLTKTMIITVLRKYRLSTEMDPMNMRRRLQVVVFSAEGYNVSLENRC